MRIAISTPAYPLPGDLTRGRYIYEIARSLAALATVKVYFHTARYPRVRWLQPRTYHPTEVVSDLSTPEVQVEAFTYPSLPGLSRVIGGLVSGASLFDRLLAFRPDVVLGYWIYPEGFAAWRCARRLNVPCVLGGLGTDIRARDAITRWFTGLALRGADQTIMVSEEMRLLTIRNFGVDPARVHTITNGVNSSIFHRHDLMKARSQLTIPHDAKLIVYVGRFVAAKGLRELVNAYSRLLADRGNIHLALIGDGVMRDELESLTTALKVPQLIHMTGGIQPEEIAIWLNAADVLCLPSYSEGYPNVVVEALACGCPVVATNVGGTNEMIDASNGILVSPRDAAGLCRALSQALDAGWARDLISAAWSRSWSDVARATLDICQRAHDDRKGSARG